MDQENPQPVAKRRRRPLWRRRRFWIVLLAILVAIVLTVWLISQIERSVITDSY
jgi:ferric-dicitrate binding protein FerR (iron transport regulator)